MEKIKMNKLKADAKKNIQLKQSKITEFLKPKLKEEAAESPKYSEENLDEEQE